MEKPQQFVIGSYTNDINKEGIHLFELGIDGKSLVQLNTFNAENASYIAITSDARLMYAVNENHTQKDSVTAISFEADANKLTLLNQIENVGADPCFITVDKNTCHLFVANYSDGSLSVLPIIANGYIDNVIQRIYHPSTGTTQNDINTHMHATVLSPDEKFLLATNLGQDTITIYEYKYMDTQPLKENSVFTYKFSPGTGPRHLLFDNSGSYVYVVGELDASLTVLKWLDGALVFVQDMKLMPLEFTGKSSAADIHFGRDGRFLYVSNRGDANQIICFEIDKATGFVALSQRIDCMGIGPRNFAIDPAGQHMLIANQYSNNVKLFGIDRESGYLSYLDVEININSPVFISFL